MSISDPQDTQSQPFEPAAVWPPPPLGQPVEPPPSYLPQFKRMNLLLLIVLFWGTLGFYQLYWMKRVIDVANARCGEVLMSMASLWFLGVVWAIDMSTIFMHVSEDTEKMLNLAGNVASLIVTFMVRGALQTAMNVEGGRNYLNKLWTFLFGIFYFQHRINVYLKKNPSL